VDGPHLRPRLPRKRHRAQAHQAVPPLGPTAGRSG
jgi:hypothetical protein